MEIKYKMKKSCRIAQLLLICLGFVLTIIRWLNVFNSNFVIINPEITSHISNFSLSLLAYLAIDSSWLTSGVKFRPVAVLGVLMIVFIYFYFLNSKGLIQINSDNQ